MIAQAFATKVDSTSGLATVNDGFHEFVKKGTIFPNNFKEHYIKQTWFFDVQASYQINFGTSSESENMVNDTKSSADKDGARNVSETTNYSLPAWKKALNRTTITLGCNDVFGQDPPQVLGGSTANYPGALYDSVGRFVYLRVTKHF